MIKIFLFFLFALVFGLLGAAHLINNALYINNKTFIFWLLRDFRTDNQWLFPIFFWAIAGGFLISGIICYKSSIYIHFRQSDTTGKVWIPSPAIRIWLRIGALEAFFVFIGYLCLNACLPGTFTAHPLTFEESLSHQGHVYLLAIEDRGDEIFNFQVYQCDASGWFCHVIYDISRRITNEEGDGVLSPSDTIEFHLLLKAPYHYLTILYDSNLSDSGKLLCPIPPS